MTSLLPPDMHHDLRERIRENKKIYPNNDERCTLSGYVRRLIGIDLYGKPLFEKRPQISQKNSTVREEVEKGGSEDGIEIVFD